MYIFLILYLGFYILGFNLGWSVLQYDELRLLQILITSIIFITIILKSNLNLSIKNIWFFLLFF